MENVSKKILLSGRVQGVFFRDSTRAKANELQLSGGVRNLHDGRVEVLVSGMEDRVQALIKWLEIGPKYAKVTTIEVISENVEDHLNVLAHFFEVKASTN